MRHQGSPNANRPAVASAVRDVKTLGLSHRDIDFIQGLRWSLEEVSRTYGVPKLLLGDFERGHLRPTCRRRSACSGATPSCRKCGSWRSS